MEPRANRPKKATRQLPFLDKCKSDREREILSKVEEIMRAENYKAWKESRARQ